MLRVYFLVKSWFRLLVYTQILVTNQGGISGFRITSVVIRGLRPSIVNFNTNWCSSNQPLFVVDGVPFQSDTNAMGSFTSGNNGSSKCCGSEAAPADLDPNNIESVNVLKGLLLGFLKRK